MDSIEFMTLAANVALAASSRGKSVFETSADFWDGAVIYLSPMRRFGRFVLLAAAMTAWAATSEGKSRPDAGEMSNADAPARMVKQAALEYPEFLLKLGDIRGTVVIECTIDEKGEPRTPRIIQTSHPAFVPPAIASLFRSRFAPAFIQGKAVPSVFQMLFMFDVRDAWKHDVGREAFSVAPQSPPNAPAEFQYDDAPRIVTLCEPVYPYDLAVAGVSGEAEVNFVVDGGGKVAAAKVLKASRPEFGAALVAAIEAWRFTPPTNHGERTMALLSRRQEFAPNNRDLTSDVDGKRIMKLLRTGKGSFCELAAIDHPPRAIYQVAPSYPPLLQEQAVAGEAVIEFIIDREGKVRAPRVVSASREEFGWAAATAVQQWFYEPPRKQGKAVDVRVTMPFGFEPNRGK